MSIIRHLGHAPEEPVAHAPLQIDQIDPDPLKLFEAWLEQALAAGVPQPLGMTLATATPQGAPSARIVLLRGIERGALLFYTNYESRKAVEIASNPRAALVWWWAEAGRQIRAEGPIEKVSAEVSEAYFRDRPRGSQIAAVISPQSEVIAGREVLLDKWKELESRLGGQPVSRPAYWGGYAVRPDLMEFWQEGANRLHDRILYRRGGAAGPWTRERLAP